MADVFQPPPTWASPILFDEATKQAIFNPVWLKWFVDLVGVINASGGGGGVVAHNSTSGLQGGTANQYYHLSAAQATYVAAMAAITGISATITTAKLTGGGANGSMTFTSGILTAQTAAT